MGYGKMTHPSLTEDELKLVLMDSHEEGIISEGEAKIIIRAFEFADKTAEAIMVPAERVDFISLARSFEDNVAVARKSMHTRFPLCRGGIDTVIGIVSMKDPWPAFLKADRSNTAFEQVLRPVIILRPDASQDKVLRLLQESRSHMGVVRDSGNAKTLGVVTLEDVLESLHGDLREANPIPIKSVEKSA
jgi:CBS domain containing-hemolysin-like protein